MPAALADSDGERTLWLNDAAMTHSLLPLDIRSSYPDYPVAPVGKTSVQAVSLDSFCGQHGIAWVEVLKLDVQGAEAAVLRGAAGMLAGAQIDVIYTELCFVSMYHGQTPPWLVLEALGRYGYRFFDLYNIRRASSGQVKWGDALFLSPRVRELAGM